MIDEAGIRVKLKADKEDRLEHVTSCSQQDVEWLLSALTEVRQERDELKNCFRTAVAAISEYVQTGGKYAHLLPIGVSVTERGPKALVNHFEGQIAELTRQRDRLVEALTPFARRADYFDSRKKADGSSWLDTDTYADDPPSDIYLGQLRAARAASAAR